MVYFDAAYIAKCYLNDGRAVHTRLPGGWIGVLRNSASRILLGRSTALARRQRLFERKGDPNRFVWREDALLDALPAPVTLP